MIYFKKIRWKNLLSTGNVFTEFDLSNRDTTLIVGENGAGKSTILDALCFVLFSKPFRKITKPQLINSITQKNLVVEVEFSIGSTQYKIIRGMKPTVFEVYQNDKLLNQSAEMKDYQEVLEKQILKVNQKSFTQVVILGSATFLPFMQLPGGQRREIIEDLLDLQIFTVMNSLLKDKVMFNSDEITRSLSDKKLVQSKIEMTKQHMLEMQNNNEKVILEKKKLEEETQEQIKELTKKFKAVSKKIEKLESQIEDDETVSKKIKSLEKLRHQIEAKVARLNDDIEFFKDHENCPTCGQDIDEKYKKEAIDKNNDKAEEYNSGLEKLAVEFDTTKQRVDEIMKVKSDVVTAQMEKFEHSASLKSLSNYIDQLRNEISKLGEQKSEESEQKLEEYEQELINVERRYNDLIEERNLLSVSSGILKDNGIKSKIIKQYIPVINKFINKYLSAMDFFVSFELDEQFNETIKSRHRDDFSYSSFSEGEKQKIDLALLFTWRSIAKLRNSINTNLLIMDEVFDSSLDGNATEYLMNIIRDISKDSNIVIISHKEHMNEKFNNVVKFIKHKNFSQMLT